MDQDLVLRAQQGDQGAFERIAAIDYPRLFRVAQGILRDRSLAEDATQRALLDVWRNIRRLRDGARYEAWSYRLLVNSCYREAGHRPDWRPISEIPAQAMPSTLGGYSQIDDRDQLERGFRRISIDQRTVIVLRCLLDLPIHEVAEVLGVAPGTVGSRLNRALAALRAAVEADERGASTGVANGVAR